MRVPRWTHIVRCSFFSTYSIRPFSSFLSFSSRYRSFSVVTALPSELSVLRGIFPPQPLVPFPGPCSLFISSSYVFVRILTFWSLRPLLFFHFIHFVAPCSRHTIFTYFLTVSNRCEERNEENKCFVKIYFSSMKFTKKIPKIIEKKWKEKLKINK